MKGWETISHFSQVVNTPCGCFKLSIWIFPFFSSLLKCWCSSGFLLERHYPCSAWNVTYILKNPKFISPPRTFIWPLTLDFKHFIETLFLQTLVESRTFTPNMEITFLFTSLPLSTHFPALFNKGLLSPASYLFSFLGHTPCHVGPYFTDDGGWYPNKIPLFLEAWSLDY